MPGEGRRLEHDELALRDHAGERPGGAEQRAEVGLAVAVQRRGDADEDRLGPVQVDGARGEARAVRRPPAAARTGCPRCASARRAGRCTLRRVDVDADDVLAGLGERDGERQPDVAQADDADAHARHGSGRSGALVGGDLGERLGAHVRARAVGAVPGDGGVERGVEVPARRPAELARGRGSRRAAAAAPRRPPRRRARLDDQPARPAVGAPAARPSRPGAASSRAEVPGRAARRRRAALGDPQVAVQRAEDVLPRPHRLRCADDDAARRASAARMQSATQPVRRPVPAADHVAGADGRDRQPERAERRGDVLLAGLRGGVRDRRRRAGRPRGTGARCRRCGSTCRS